MRSVTIFISVPGKMVEAYAFGTSGEIKMIDSYSAVSRDWGQDIDALLKWICKHLCGALERVVIVDRGLTFWDELVEKAIKEKVANVRFPKYKYDGSITAEKIANALGKTFDPVWFKNKITLKDWIKQLSEAEYARGVVTVMFPFINNEDD